MNETQIILSENEERLLHAFSRQTGKAEGELLREALGLLADRLADNRENRLATLRQACGIWKDREDLLTMEKLREEFR